MKFNEPDFGHYLRTIMYERRLTTRNLASMVGLSMRQMHHLLTGPNISAHRLRKFSDALGEDLFIQYLSDETKALIEKGRAATVAPELSAAEKLDRIEEELKKIRTEL